MPGEQVHLYGWWPVTRRSVAQGDWPTSRALPCTKILSAWHRFESQCVSGMPCQATEPDASGEAATERSRRGHDTLGKIVRVWHMSRRRVGRDGTKSNDFQKSSRDLIDVARVTLI